MLKKNNKITIAVLLVIILAGGALIYYYQNKNASENSIFNLKNDDIRRKTDLAPAYTNVNYEGTKTNVEGVSVVRQDGRASDGPFICTLYKTDTKLILATYMIGGGVTPPGSDTRPKLTYRTEELSKDQINKLVTNYCDDAPRHFTAPQPDR